MTHKNVKLRKFMVSEYIIVREEVSSGPLLQRVQKCLCGTCFVRISFTKESGPKLTASPGGDIKIRQTPLMLHGLEVKPVQ